MTTRSIIVPPARRPKLGHWGEENTARYYFFTGHFVAADLKQIGGVVVTPGPAFAAQVQPGVYRGGLVVDVGIEFLGFASGNRDACGPRKSVRGRRRLSGTP